ncbi:branched-chain amino acid ABC transporter substrate-binding protein [Hydrogenophaga sp. 5NK40-0174]
MAARALPAQAAWWNDQRQRLKLAFIDPLTGPAGDIGRHCLHSWQYIAEGLGRVEPHASALRIDLAPFDNSASPRESLKALKVAIDQGFRIILQGNGSGVTAALAAAIDRHNLRNPADPVILINYASMDPALTRGQCSPWHYRVDADTAMKVQALSRYLEEDTVHRSVYLLNQNYAHGQQVSAYAQQALSRRQGMQVVGDELHVPFVLGSFDKQVEKIRESGATALITANWGADLRRLVDSLHAVDYPLAVFTYYGSLMGTPGALASKQVNSRLDVFQVSGFHSSHPGPWPAFQEKFRRRFDEDFVTFACVDGMQMLLRAVRAAGSTRVSALVPHLEGIRFDGHDGVVSMRASDHQLIRPVYVSRWVPVSKAYPHDCESTGFTFAPVRKFNAGEMNLPAQCDMTLQQG